MALGDTVLQSLVKPFRLLAGMLGLVGVGGIAIRLQSSAPVDVSFGAGVVSVMTLLGYAFVPRALLARYWWVVLLLACVGLGFTVFQWAGLATGKVDGVLLAGYLLLAGVYGVMLVDAVCGRQR